MQIMVIFFDNFLLYLREGDSIINSGIQYASCITYKYIVKEKIL